MSMDEEDPQLALSRPASLAISPPVMGTQAQAQSPPPVPTFGAPGLTTMPASTLSSVKAAAAPSSSNAVTVSNVDLSATSPESITSDQGYVNKVVRSLSALRSAVVSRRQPPVLNERSYR